MKSMSPACLILLNAMLSNGCTPIAPTETVSEAVIESILPRAQAETPWRLDSAWQGGGLGGSVLRGSSIEHVVRQVDNKLSRINSGSTFSGPALSELDSSNIKTTSVSATNEDLALQRAWRKYCHHQLDMTAADQALISRTSIPLTVLKQGCNPSSLLK